MKKLLALICVSVLMLAPACCRRGPCDPCGVVEECNPLDTFNGSEQCVNICPPLPECRETCPPTVKCETEEVPVQLFRKRKTCVVTTVGPVEATCETDVVKCPEIQEVDMAVVAETGPENGVVSKTTSRRMVDGQRRVTTTKKAQVRKSRRQGAPYPTVEAK